MDYQEQINELKSKAQAEIDSYNTVYFSFGAIVQKCADFLNRKYKLGDYTDEA